MHLGVPKEVKAGENRVAMTPAGVAELTRLGHQVLVQTGAGIAAGFSDMDYQRAGAHLSASIAEVYASARLIVKVKEPQPSEYSLLQPHHVLFTYLHLAADPVMASALLDSGASCIAYETVRDSQGRLPLLAPMSEIAGRMAIQAGAHHLEVAQGGKGILLGGVPGVAPAQVVILGAGVVGSQAAAMALGLGAQVTIVDTSLGRLRQLDELWRGRLQTEYATRTRIAELVQGADLVVGAVLNAGDAAPRLLERDDIARMRPASVLVDVAIDQGGCFATSRPTSHQNPTYVEEGVIHYCVANIPSAVARTATLGLTNATLDYVQRLAKAGLDTLKSDAGFAQGLNVCRGAVTHPTVASALNKRYQPIERVV
ncbi:alanine dehydrogenase [Cellvibrio japonicus]|uniref:Alanine dehydrogenase n=1 Tax=Cellvibrio japonicus (strain Ueda107) TaxID=498211 RepID=B3PID3_CELJU|nr:alanine dehydrogenase [Cellvibrio japonicus]ACE84058.1 alanine dehydrogenase [Cellvibrio japonicus Ueda107]QEI12534.1 alanine dehydrogenase [Cellvibrio japonicus]QEI16108.1 alanine dehydrogenase [Cellvibrio japonicus]QEI19686.1 alanine dehydrogenase [Cellvibrio japonicus]